MMKNLIINLNNVIRFILEKDRYDHKVEPYIDNHDQFRSVWKNMRIAAMAKIAQAL